MNITAPWMIKEESSYKHYSHPNLTQTTIAFFNNQYDSFSTNSPSSELVGGINEKWNKIIGNKGQTYVEHHKPKEAGMVKRTYEIKQSLDVEQLNTTHISYTQKTTKHNKNSSKKSNTGGSSNTEKKNPPSKTESGTHKKCQNIRSSP